MINSEMFLDYCGKFFASQKHLNKHLKYHEKPQFVCNYEGCEKGFILNSLLNEHFKTHNPSVKDFHCEICSKSFCLQRHLRKHKNGVHSGKTFRCERCPYGANVNSRRDNLRTHYYRTHNMSKEEVDNIMPKLTE